jgi:hypothetical protein
MRNPSRLPEESSSHDLLKRQRTNFEPSDRGEKRACSNWFPSNLAQDEQATEFQNSTHPSAQAPVVVPKRCIHKIVTVTSHMLCVRRCAPFNFVRYIDGHAWGVTLAIAHSVN